MKLGWLVWRYDDDDDTPEFHTTEPENFWYKVVLIVYTEIVEK